MPALPLYLRCISRFSWLTCTFMPTQPRSITAPPLDERFGLACIVEGRIPFHQGTSEPQGLFRADRKRPDGLTLTPWRDGRCATWDVTITDTVAASYLNSTASCAGSAAEAAASRKEEKYAEIAAQYHFIPLAFETFGPINQAGCDFLSSLGHRLSLVSDDPRESSFLFQRLSVAIQRFNSVCFCNSFGNLPAQFLDQPRHT